MKNVLTEYHHVVLLAKMFLVPKFRFLKRETETAERLAESARQTPPQSAALISSSSFFPAVVWMDSQLTFLFSHRLEIFLSQSEMHRQTSNVQFRLPICLQMLLDAEVKGQVGT